VESKEATHCLAALLGRSPGLDPLILARLSQRTGGRGAADDSVLESIRRYLGRPEPELVSAAATACGDLGDDLAVVQLIGLVDHEDARVRQSVFKALHEISGLALGSDAERWTSWYQSELRWWEDESEPLLVLVESGHGVEFARAARIVLEHHLFRDRIAESFAQVLRRHNPQEVHLSCRALEQLRSPVAVRALVECLDRDEPLVRESAWRALRAITGAELPPEADSWAASG